MDYNNIKTDKKETHPNIVKRNDQKTKKQQKNAFVMLRIYCGNIRIKTMTKKETKDT